MRYIGVDATLTNHKKSVQPEMNRVRKLDILPKCAEVRKAMHGNLLDEMDDPWVSSDEEAPDSKMHLLQVASLNINEIKDKENACGRNEW